MSGHLETASIAARLESWMAALAGCSDASKQRITAEVTALATAYWVAKDREEPAAPARVPLTDEMLQAAIDAYESSPEEDYDDVRAALLATGVFEEVPR